MTDDRDILARLRDLEGVAVIWSCTHECWTGDQGHTADCRPIIPSVIEDAICEIMILRQQLQALGVPPV